MKILRSNRESGESGVIFILMIVFIVLTVAAGSAFIWAFMQMNNYKNNSDKMVAEAVSTAKAEQKETLNKQFDESYKKPYSVFTGPDTYGKVTFNYPKTWSVYVDGSGSAEDSYKAYLNPGFVTAPTGTSTYALRVVIYNYKLADFLGFYSDKVTIGALKASTVRLSDATDDATDTYGKGTRLDGQFDKTINGSGVFFSVRDRTLAIFVDNNNFMKDFNDTILKTLTYKE